MPFTVKSQKTEHLPGAPFRLMGQHPRTPSTENSSLAAHRSGASLFILVHLPLCRLLVDSEDITADVFKVMGRITGAEHGDMLVLSDGYMTAWMLYQLQGNEEAGAAFIGYDAEILQNEGWQDVEKKQMTQIPLNQYRKRESFAHILTARMS